MSLVDAKADYKWVVYTALPEGATAVGLTDGFAPCDYNDTHRKQCREQDFPFTLAKQALDITLETAQASVESDRTHILNKMICEADLNKPLPDEKKGEKYDEDSQKHLDELNETLRACFAAGSLHAALKHGEGAPFCAALAKGRMHELSLVFSQFAAFDAKAAQTLVDSMPATLEKLSLQSDLGPALALVLAPWLRISASLTTVLFAFN